MESMINSEVFDMAVLSMVLGMFTFCVVGGIALTIRWIVQAARRHRNLPAPCEDSRSSIENFHRLNDGRKAGRFES